MFEHIETRQLAMRWRLCTGSTGNTPIWPTSAAVGSALTMRRKSKSSNHLVNSLTNPIHPQYSGIVPFLGLSVVLLVGCILSALTFLAELVVFHFRQEKRVACVLSGNNSQMANALRMEALRTDGGAIGQTEDAAGERVKAD